MLGAIAGSLPVRCQAPPHPHGSSSRNTLSMRRLPHAVRHASGAQRTAPFEINNGRCRPDQYGGACPARAAGDGAEAKQDISSMGGYGGATTAVSPERNDREERQLPFGSIDVDASDICSQEECPFPSHRAFDAEQLQRRLRNQASRRL